MQLWDWDCLRRFLDEIPSEIVEEMRPGASSHYESSRVLDGDADEPRTKGRSP